MSLVTITETIVNPPLQIPETAVIVLRGYYSNAFVAVDGVTPVEGGNGQLGFYYEVSCNLNDDGNVVIPQFEIQPTVGSNPTAGFFGQLYIDDAPGQVIFGSTAATAGWQIPTATPTSFGVLAVYNAAAQLVVDPRNYLTAAQTRTLILALAELFAYMSGPVGPGVVPYATAERQLADSLITFDGTDTNIQTVNYFQAGDWQVLQNGTFISVNDSFSEDGGRSVVYAGGDGGNEYAGITADCSNGNGAVFVQSTGITHLYGVNQVTTLGDGQNEQNGTQVVINDPTRMVIITAANQVANDPSIGAEQFSPYLDEAVNKILLRTRYSDGTYKTAELPLYDGSSLIEVNEAAGTVVLGDVAGAEGETTLTVDDDNGVVSVEASNGMFVNGDEVYTVPSIPNIDLTPTVQEVVDALVALGLVTQS